MKNSQHAHNFCTKCGAKVQPHFKFCTICGNPIGKEQKKEVAIRPSPKPKEIPLWERLYDEGTVLLNERRPEEALNKFQQALEIKDDDHELLTNLGITYLHLKKLEEGLKWLDRSLELNPNNPMALFNKGYFLYMNSRYDEAVEVLETLLKYSPNFAQARMILMDAKRNRELFSNIMDKKIPSGALDHFKKGLLHSNNNQIQEAINYMKLAIAEFPNFAEAYMNLGNLNFAKGEIDDALKNLNKALEIDPKLIQVWSIKGMAFDSLKQYQKAIDCYDEAIKIDPFFPPAWNNKGLALTSLGRYEEAIKAYDKAIELNPDHGGYYHNLAVAFKKLGKIERAIENYQKAVELDPNNEQAKENIETLRHSSSPREEGTIRTVVDGRNYCPRCNKKNYTNSEKCPHCGTLMFSVNIDELLREAVELEALGNFERAFINLEQIKNKDPTNSEAWYYRGKAHCALAEFRNAAICFSKAQELGFGGLQLLMYGMTAKSNITNFKRPNLSKTHIENLELKNAVLFPDEESWQATGAAYQMLMQYEEAYKSYQKALSIKPDYAPAIKNSDFLIKLSK